MKIKEKTHLLLVIGCCFLEHNIYGRWQSWRRFYNKDKVCNIKYINDSTLKCARRFSSADSYGMMFEFMWNEHWTTSENPLALALWHLKTIAANTNTNTNANANTNTDRIISAGEFFTETFLTNTYHLKCIEHKVWCWLKSHQHA